MFKKILIANRGEIALRIIRTLKEMGIKTVAVYSKSDLNSLHVLFADEAVCIGESEPEKSYLKISNIIAAAEITNADAIHPGYGFLSENANFAFLCEKSGIKFIGPPSEQIEKMENKSIAIKIMKKAGILCIPGSNKNISNYEDLKKIANDIGYPIMIKASFGGGGRGIREVWNNTELKNSWNISLQESKKSFGKGDIYLEKLIKNSHHIEIQIAGDKYGTFCHLSERDCSIQRRNQKIIEETPSPFLTKNLREKICKIAINIAKNINYEGLGTIEFLVDEKQNCYFMEMNTRIQVEHAITEEVTGIDLIKEQVLIHAGNKISGKNFYPKMHSIECRINAENPYKNFQPMSGKINHINFPGGHGIRIDTDIYAGYFISPYYDSMLAKLITTSSNRNEAISKMNRALNEFIIEGIYTTIPLHKKIMCNKNFLKGDYNTKFINKMLNI